MQQRITIENPVHLSLKSQPVRQGVPWPQGAVWPHDSFAAQTETGAPLPVAARTLNLWPDGSVQWSLLDFSLDLEPSAKQVIIVNSAASELVVAQTLIEQTVAEPTAAEQIVAPLNPVLVSESKGAVRAGNGLVNIVLSKRARELVSSWKSVDVGHIAETNGFDIELEDETGVLYSAARCKAKRVFVEEANPLRAVLRVEGKHQAASGSTLLDFWLRFTITANRSDVKVTYHYRNLEAQEPGVTLRSMVMRMQTGLPDDAQRMIVHSCRGRDFLTTPIRLQDDFEIVASNTPDLDTYPETHQGITGGGAGRVFIRQPELLRDEEPKPWFLQNVADFKFGNVFPPEWGVWSTLGLVSAKGSLLVLPANMVGLHPKSLSICGHTLEYSIWPKWAGLMEITQGEGRTLDFFVGSLPGNASDEQLLTQYFSWEFGNIYSHHGNRLPIKVSLDADHVRDCAVFSIDKLPRFEPSEHFAFERKVKSEWTPDEAIPAHGHWHYGDVFLNYAIGVNNEEMVGLMWFQEYLRTGRADCFDRALAQTQHILDVDIVMHSSDPYQNGGMCAHGPRHNHCAAYPSHMWFTELLFAYALTGDEEFKKGAMRVCDNLVFWVNDEKGFSIISADGRESGQPLINLAWTYQFAPEQRYLDAMWKIVRESFMAKVKEHGHLTYMKPHHKLQLLRYDGYGEWAAWEGLFWVWELTRDEELKQFILSQLEWRLTEERMGTSGGFRAMDFNAAAYAYLMTGERQWLDRVARAFKVAFRASQWQIGWIKSMYFIKLAFEHNLINDDDVLLS